MILCSINSGSNGNCYYVGNDKESVLIDAGISCREIERRMTRARLEIDSVKAVFISHEHSDHTRGVEVLSRKHRIPVYLSSATYIKSMLWLEQDLTRIFSPFEIIDIGGFRVNTFPKKHDGIDPHSFTVSHDGITVGVFTDIGSSCINLEHHFSQCHAVFLEANYDPLMLEKGRYPVHLKNRIRGEFGHLSNHDSLDLFMRKRSPDLRLLMLSHLSEENNHPGIVKGMFDEHAGSTRIEIASRYSESAVFKIPD
jgi:phosphoribosyl 1,2-cyclic phosphodiesterase